MAPSNSPALINVKHVLGCEILRTESGVMSLGCKTITIRLVQDTTSKHHHVTGH